jgi:hypothetical protein
LRAPLPEDAEGELGRAALLEQLDRAVQVDIVPASELDGGSRGVSGPLELGGAPRLDELLLGLANFCFRSRHLADLLLCDLFGETKKMVLPIPGDSLI